MSNAQSNNAWELVLASNVPSDFDRVSALTSRLNNCQCRWVRSSYEMMDLLRQKRIPVVVCRRTLPDANWKGALLNLRELHEPPSVVVLTEREDIDLWTEVLNQGGFDTLPLGTRLDAATHMLQQACKRWNHRHEILTERRKNVGWTDWTSQEKETEEQDFA